MPDMEGERLDQFSKILLATQALQYMSHCIFSTNVQLDGVDHASAVRVVSRHKKVLDDVAKGLGKLMEEVGEYINGSDMICPIDERITAEAFKVVVHGKDLVDA